MRKPVFVVCNQLKLKLACSATGASQKLDILDIETKGIILSKQRITKALIRLRGCTGWSAPLLFAYVINRFPHDVAHILSDTLLHGSQFFSLKKGFHRLICAFVVRIWQKQVFSWHGSFATIKKNIFTFSCALCMSSLDAWTRCNEQLPDAQAIFCMAFIVLRSGTTLVAWKYNILNFLSVPNHCLLMHRRKDKVGQAERKRVCHMRTTKSADQPAHPRSLISVFVVHALDRIISLVSRSDISRF